MAASDLEIIIMLEIGLDWAGGVCRVGCEWLLASCERVLLAFCFAALLGL